MTTASAAGEIHFAAQRKAIVNYLRADQLCYRAYEPETLAERQDAAWNPLLAWIKSAHSIDLRIGRGIAYVEQSDAAIAAMQAALQPATGEELDAMRIAAEITGSAVIALALWKGFSDPDALFEASRVDEIYQMARWGEDPEALARTAALKRDFNAAAKMLRPQPE